MALLELRPRPRRRRRPRRRKPGPGRKRPPTPAVLAEQLGVTDYQKRLEQLQSKNPFKRQYMATPDERPALRRARPRTTSSDSTAASTRTRRRRPTEHVSTASQAPTSSPPSSTAPPEPLEPTLYVFQAGPRDWAPGRREPPQARRAGQVPAQRGEADGRLRRRYARTWSTRSSWSRTTSAPWTGDGRCVPGPSNCRLLRLKVGEEAKLAYAPEGDRTYKLRLHGIDLAPFDASASDKRGKRGSEFPSGFALAASR